MPCYNPFGVCTTYWKVEHLEDYGYLSNKELRVLLEQRNYQAPKSADVPALRECLRRSDVGMQSYVSLTNAGLRDLIAQRGIETDFGIGNKGGRAELVGALTTADYHPKFHRFSHLPPEIRIRIYGHYFAEFKKPLHAPIQPPLTLTSRLIRHEALPLFYASSRFVLDLEVPTTDCGMIKRKSSKVNLIMPDQTFKWLTCTKAKNLADIQHIDISVVLPFYMRSTKTIVVSIDSREGHRIKHKQWNDLNVAMLNRKLSGLVKNINRRGNGWQIYREDFYALRKIMEMSIGR